MRKLSSESGLEERGGFEVVRRGLFDDLCFESNSEFERCSLKFSSGLESLGEGCVTILCEMLLSLGSMMLSADENSFRSLSEMAPKTIFTDRILRKYVYFGC